MAIPTEIVAGTTAIWDVAAPTLSTGVLARASDGWTLTYAMIGSSGKISITAEADGDDFHVHVPATDVLPATLQTQSWTAGHYAWTSFASLSGDRHVVANGALTVLADPAAVATVAADSRTTAQRDYDAVTATISARVAGDLPKAYQLSDGRRIERDGTPELVKLQGRLLARLNHERDLLRVKAGHPSKRQIGVAL